MAKGTLGLVGLGNIGTPIASRLAERFAVMAYDSDATRAMPKGVKAAGSLRELIAQAETIVLVLPTTESVLATAGEIAAAPAQERGVRLVVDLSTIGVETAVRESEIFSEAGLMHLDSPVSGGTRRARDGTLATMCAGDPRAVDAAKPVLEQIATKIFMMGEKAGMGQAMKIANNIISAAALAITSEALIFGERMGLSPEKMIDVINVSTGRTEVSEVKFTQTILPRKYSGAYSRVMGKDVSLFLRGTDAVGLESPMARRTGEIWSEFVNESPSKDFQMIYEHLRSKMETKR